ncbi:hypothetical protein RBSWK_03107 [Rhodopirellula baltica SWK14]|uniref:Uncharacterized protein n=1 Tax=Rhodopirellula baltica SWK14 TaxID=993516 RepID=L7CH80_RHOBT|nr:hypothetical protein RBSWK_03107 [Rhodopirellula baltica SWK14]
MGWAKFKHFLQGSGHTTVQFESQSSKANRDCPRKLGDTPRSLLRRLATQLRHRQFAKSIKMIGW